MAKTLESAQKELKALDLSYYGELPQHKKHLEIVLNNLEENEEIKAMVYGIHKRMSYLICATDSQIVCGNKPLMGKQKEMQIKMDDIKSISLKSGFLSGSSIILSQKNGTELKFNSDEKKNITKFVNAASTLV